ncbi:DUF397 domain-containing protein [Streptomyces sp. G45]|uniref:DUF397 domain-containing protein n=1 Tax=Streptomyces sp. G45 TaxID=3406627 RepID=UPI003C15B99B
MNSSTGLAWFKSSYSDSEGQSCLEVATEPAAVHIRDSKDPGRGQLIVTPATWAAFLPIPRTHRDI